MGPGNLPLKWSPSNPKDKKCLQECKLCEGYKAPRAHHCRQCKRWGEGRGRADGLCVCMCIRMCWECVCAK